MSRAASKAGLAAENTLDQMHRLCEIAGIARVRRNAAPMRITGRKGALVTGFLLGAQGVDFKGWTLRGGRAIAIECKETKAPRFYLRLVQGEQRTELDSLAQAGGVALLVVQHGADYLAYRWEDVRSATSLDVRTTAPTDRARGAYLGKFC